MISEVEREMQVYRMRGLLSAGNRVVWSQSTFPEQHRPDVGALTPLIRIDTSIANELKPHPGMKPEVLEAYSEEAKAKREVSDKIAWYDFESREITLNPLLALDSDEVARRIVFHEASHDVDSRPEIILPAEFTRQEVDRLKAIIELGFPEGARLKLEDVYMVKSGFRRYVMSNGFLISMLLGGDIEHFNELYSTSHEMVTDQVYRRGGDIQHFDSDARSGQLRVLDGENHPYFATMLMKVLQVIDWRDLLSAFKTGDLRKAIRVLRENADDPEYGDGILLGLFEAMKRDEERIYFVNRALGASFTRPEDFGALR